MILYEYTFRRKKVAEVDLDLIRTPFDCEAVLRPLLGEELEQEHLVVLCLNTKNAVMGHEVVYRGNIAGSSVRVGEVFAMPVRMKAAAIIIGHNHPSGDATPSGEDLRITSEFAQAGKLLDIELLDHLIIGSGARYTSMRALGQIGIEPTSAEAMARAIVDGAAN